MKLIGENIRKERKKQMLTMEQLAEMAGITDNFLGKIERGDGKPSFATIDSIASALNVGIDFLKGNMEHGAEYRFIQSIMEMNNLSEKEKAKFIEFISSSVKFFKD
ncbi:MAG: helix-turn-helix transcriptional regulator [Oscillospiraceae bacterium]|nr:helix-turn-helix transcriptional regulator [Oscillospiraceae bacterium]